MKSLIMQTRHVSNVVTSIVDGILFLKPLTTCTFRTLTTFETERCKPVCEITLLKIKFSLTCSDP